MPNTRLPAPTPESLRRNLKGTVAIIAVCAVGLVCIGWFWWREQAFLASAVHTTGTVIDRGEHLDEDRHRTYYPVLTFTDRVEKKWTFQSRKVDNDCYIGETLPVVYNPDDPAEAHIDSGWVAWGTLSLFTLLDLGILVPSLLEVSKLLPAIRTADAARQSSSTPADP